MVTAVEWVTWAAWVVTKSVRKIKQARLEEILAAFFLKFKCKECLTHDKDALHCWNYE
jgi:hypothetical protein